MGTRAATSSISVQETQDPGPGPGGMMRRQDAFQKTKIGSTGHFQTTIFVSHFNTASLFLKELLQRSKESFGFFFFK